jgi:hypothetical protein
MRRLLPVGVAPLVGLLGLILGPGSAAHAAPPSEFGSDWDDPRTAAPAIERPGGPSCTVRIVDNKFVNFDPFQGAYAPPAQCTGPWAKVVLTLSGAVKGRQFDRLGRLAIGGVTVFKTSTPEPSVDGIKWTVEKDVTGYGPLLRAPQSVTMWLGNVVDDTYTGILDIQVDLTFYSGAAPAGTPDDVLAVDQNGLVTVPRNSERLAAQVYVTGSGGGCEEFWYLAAPPSTGYSCAADAGPYREVQVLIDGQVAGIAAPYPHIYTGGWSNPFLWYAVPAPRAFDVKPIEYDLSPFTGRLTDGKAHSVTVNVIGVPVGQNGWEAPVNILAWRDIGSAQVTGDVLATSVSPLTNEVTVSTVDGQTEVKTHAAQRFSAIGFVRTSHGRVTYVVNRAVGNESRHRWGADENPDALTATWTDTATSVGGGSVTRHDARYAIDGSIFVSAENRLTTTITVTDAFSNIGVHTGLSTLDDTYTGEASWTLGVPRSDRHAQGTSRERYHLDGYDRTISTVNGYVV